MGRRTFQNAFQKLCDNKDLLCSTVNYIQYLVISYNGKESEKVCVCVYIHTYIYTHTYIYN